MHAQHPHRLPPAPALLLLTHSFLLEPEVTEQAALMQLPTEWGLLGVEASERTADCALC